MIGLTPFLLSQSQKTLKISKIARVKILNGIIVQHPIVIDLRRFQRFVPVFLSKLILTSVRMSIIGMIQLTIQDKIASPLKKFANQYKILMLDVSLSKLLCLWQPLLLLLKDALKAFDDFKNMQQKYMNYCFFDMQKYIYC